MSQLYQRFHDSGEAAAVFNRKSLAASGEARLMEAILIDALSTLTLDDKEWIEGDGGIVPFAYICDCLGIETSAARKHIIERYSFKGRVAITKWRIIDRGEAKQEESEKKRLAKLGRQDSRRRILIEKLAKEIAARRILRRAAAARFHLSTPAKTSIETSKLSSPAPRD